MGTKDNAKRKRRASPLTTGKDGVKSVEGKQSEGRATQGDEDLNLLTSQELEAIAIAVVEERTTDHLLTTQELKKVTTEAVGGSPVVSDRLPAIVPAPEDGMASRKEDGRNVDPKATEFVMDLQFALR